jgi:CubicO group peptidase (beta-lactamase class C family)
MFAASLASVETQSERGAERIGALEPPEQMAMASMHRVTSSLFAAALSAIVVGAASLHFHEQSPPPAAVAGRPAPLDRASIEQRVDALLNAHVTVNRFSGAVLLASQGKPLVAKGYGYANVEWQIPNTTTTKFRIGSITKQFTSMLVMQLRERGRIKLEDSVCLYVSPCPDTWKAVTIHHLLTHTSGIPSYTGIASWRDTNMVPKTVEQMMAIFRDLPVEWRPGEKYAYNNSGYFLLGVVIEKASGEPYEQALQAMILTPLAMMDTGYDSHTKIIARRASGYRNRSGALQNAAAIDMRQPFAAGGLYSTVEDLLKWDQALYTDRLLPTAAKQRMWTPFKENYAYGWLVSAPVPNQFGGHRRIEHGGGINGFSSVIIRLPEPNVTAIVLANNESVNASAIGRDLLAIFYGERYTMPAISGGMSTVK